MTHTKPHKKIIHTPQKTKYIQNIIIQGATKYDNYNSIHYTQRTHQTRTGYNKIQKNDKWNSQNKRTDKRQKI